MFDEAQHFDRSLVHKAVVCNTFGLSSTMQDTSGDQRQDSVEATHWCSDEFVPGKRRTRNIDSVHRGCSIAGIDSITILRDEELSGRSLIEMDRRSEN